MILTPPVANEDSYFDEHHFLFHTEPERDDRQPMNKLSERQIEIIRQNLAGACDSIDQEMW